MAKKRIQNYVFLPGTASGDNLYPNAYELIENNKDFIIAEANQYISNSIVIDNAINLNPNAVTLLTNNKTFLQDEILAYIQYNINNNIGPFVGYTYDSDKCRRDTGYVIDAYIYDLRYGGNEKIRFVASQYWLAGTPQIDGDRQPEVWAHTKLRDIITKYIFPKVAYSSQQSPVTSLQNTAGSAAETHTSQKISVGAEILTDVISNGLSVLQETNLYPNAALLLENNVGFLKDEITAWIATQVANNIVPFVGFTYDVLKCKRDVGYVLDAYIWDLKNSGTEKTREVGQQYWLNGIAQIDGSRAPEIAAHTQLVNIINNFILLKIAYTSQQNPAITTQNTSGSSAESGTTGIITTLSGIFLNILQNGLAALAAVNLRPNATTLLSSNKEFLKDEIVAWIATQVSGAISPFAGYTYDSAKCERDVGYVIDGYIYDLRYGGKVGTASVAQEYWVGTTAQVDGDRSPEVAAHTKLRDIINNYILTQTAYPTVQTPPLANPQILSGSAAESGSTSLITTLSSIIISTIQTGLSALPAPPLFTSFRNFAGYIYDTSKCARDLGYVLDAYLNDIRYGGNVEIRFVASRYWEGTVPQVDGDRRPEIVTHQFVRDLINFYLLPQQNWTALQGVETQYTNNNIVFESAVRARLWSLVDVLLNVVKNGLLSLPTRIPGVTSIYIQGKISLDEILLITNTTNNQILYNFSSSDYNARISYFSTYNSNNYSRSEDFPSFLNTADFVTTIILDADTTTSSTNDDIQIFVEKNELTIRPWDFGTDAIERMRVATPQSMLDADFEYGLQPTKWQAIGLLRGYPSVYEIPGSDTGVITVTTDASSGTAGVGSSLITVTTSAAHGLAVGGAFTIKALANTITGFSRAEGTFLVNTVPSATTFTYYATAKVGTTPGQILATTYTQLRKASYYTGANVGTPNFIVLSNGNTGTITSVFATSTASDQIAFSGTAPASGSPLSGTGINSGTQVSGVVGSGGISVSTTVLTTVNSGVTSFDVANPSGILEGMAIDNGSGTAIFVNGLSGNTVSLTGPITDNRVGSTQSYTNVASVISTANGAGAQFTVYLFDNSYGEVDVVTPGSSYNPGDQILITGNNLGGLTPANDLTITVQTVDISGGITSVAFTGTSVTQTFSYNSVPQDATSGAGVGSTWNVTRSDALDSTAGLGIYTVGVNNPGTGFAPGDTVTLLGTNFGGASPANDITITVQTVDSGTGAQDVLVTGTAVGTDQTFSTVSGTNIPNAGLGATFNITRSGGSYTIVTINNPGSGYVAGNVVRVLGTDLSGTSTTNDLLITVQSVTGGAITSITSFGTAVPGTTVDFYSALTLSEVTTTTIPNGTTINYSGIAQIEVTFASAHGLVPGASVTVAITSTGSNHGLAAGPFFVENVPSLNVIRYTARTSGTIDVATTLTGIIYTRSDSYFIHRPYDGGVQLGTGGPQHGAQAIRMSKKYIRYQSGKGVMYTTGAMFAPSYDLQNLSATDTSIGSYITLVTDDVDHGCQVGGIIKIQGVETSGYNDTYTVVDVINERQLRVQAQSVLGNIYATLGPTAKMSLVSWHGATVRAGAFDDQNGMYWQYNGESLAVGLRSATFQLAGTVNVTRDTNLVTGTNTRFRDQLQTGDKIVIKGMTHVVTNISSQTSMTVTPDYRGASNAVASKLCLIVDQIINQENFNIDKLDGTGPSGYNVDISTMQMIGIQYTWYGAGFIDFMLRGSDGNYVMAHRIRNSNINTEAYMRTGNLPVRYEVINESAVGKLANSITATQTTVPLLDATNFPNESGLVYIDNELIAFTGKTGNTLTGCSRSAPLTNFVGGAQRTFRAGAASTHEFNTGVVLVSNTISPIISHWGSAFLTDGRFDEDRGYIFSYTSTGLSISTTKQTAFLIRLAPSVSNAIVGDLGERELLNRAQLLLKSIAITSDGFTGSTPILGGIVIEGVLNPSNYPTDPSLITWGGLQSLASGGQPSFAQIAPGGSVTWSSAIQTTATGTLLAAVNGNLTVPNNSVFNRGSGSSFFYATQTSWSSIGATTGFLINDAKYPAGTTISSITASPTPTATTLGELTGQATVYNGNFSTTFNAGSTQIWISRSSWETLVGTSAPTQAVGLRILTGFNNTAYVTSVGALVSFGGGSNNQYYPVNFNEASTSTLFAGTTITFRIGGNYSNNLNNIFFTSASWTALPIDAGRVSNTTNDAKFVGGTTITAISSARTFRNTSNVNTTYYLVTFSNNISTISGGLGVTFTHTPYYVVNTSANSTSAVNANANVQLTLQQSSIATNFVYLTQASWETLVSGNSAGIGSEVSDAKFPANTRVTNVSALSTFSGTSYYRITFNQTSNTVITTPGTITFRFGIPPYALPGETVFSFIAQPGTDGELDLGELKELTNTALGGRGTYPNGPDVLAINVYKVSGSSATANIILRWGEAQA
jgi:hypothetical protein